MIKVCCYCEKWESGGIESFLTSLYEAVPAEAVSVDLVVAQETPGIYHERLRKRGVRIFELSGSCRKTSANYRLLKQHLSQYKYDVFHLNAYHALSLVYLRAARKSGISVRLAHSHNDRLRPSLLRPIKNLLHKICRRTFQKEITAAAAPSAAAAAFLFCKDTPWVYLKNGIDPARFSFSSDKRRTLREQMQVQNAVVIGEVGRYCSQKNQLFLLDAFALCRQKRPETVLWLIGEGEDSTAIAHRVHELGLEDAVRLIPPTESIQDWFFAMDIFCLPSLFEGLGIVAIEAQAAALPVFCSDNVPFEASYTDTYTALPLQAQLWGEALASCHPNADRRDMTDAVVNAGYTVACTANTVMMLYQGKTPPNTKGGSEPCTR